MTHCQVLDHNNEPVTTEWTFRLYCTVIKFLREKLGINPYREYEMEFPEKVNFVDPETDKVVLTCEKGWKFKHWG